MEELPATSQQNTSDNIGQDLSNEDPPILSLLLTFARNRSTIGWTTAIFVGVGLMLAIFSPPKYTASAKVIREPAEESSVGMSGLAALRGFGINLVGGGVGLTEETYPDIIRSREVRLAVARSKFFFNDLDSTMSLVEYDSRSPGIFGMMWGILKKATIQLPGTIMSLFRDKPPDPIVLSESEVVVYPTEEENESIEALLSRLSHDVSRTSGIMTISVATHDPLLSVQIADAFTEQLKKRVRDIYTQKARINVDFILQRFDESKVDLEKAEEALAQFLDRNVNPATARLQTEVERLQRQVTFKAQLYGELQTQLMQAEIDLQRSQPVITLIEKPVPPRFRSAPKRKFIVIMSLLLGIFCGGLLAFTRQYWQSLELNTRHKNEYLEIRDALNPRKWW